MTIVDWSTATFSDEFTSRTWRDQQVGVLCSMWNVVIDHRCDGCIKRQVLRGKFASFYFDSVLQLWRLFFPLSTPSCIARSIKINQSRHGQPSLQTCHSLQTSATYQKEGKMKTSNAASWIFAPQLLLLPTTFQVKQCLVCPPLFLNMLPRSPNSGGGFALWWIVFAADCKKQLLVLSPSCWISSHC